MKIVSIKTNLLAIYLSLLLFSCQSSINTKSELKNSGLAEGEQLAKTYCTTCHKYAEPELLNKGSWGKYVLPRMGYFWGIFPHDSVRQNLIENGSGGSEVRSANIFPEKKIIPDSLYEKIKHFYLSEAPDSLELPIKPQTKSLSNFVIHKSRYRVSPPSTTLVNITNENSIFLGDANTQSFYQFSKNAKLLNVAKLKEGPVWMQEFTDQILVLIMGSFSPTDNTSGLLVSLPKQKKGKAKILIKDLQRPVHFEVRDLNNDQLPDIVISEFAKWTGSLSWWKNKGDGTFERQMLRNKPGATKSYIRDLNSDGHPDIIALFGQGDEGVFTYYNDGNGSFQEEVTLRFSPSHGSSYFDLYDFDKDGHDDIIYTAGDNADFKPVLKPYHGIYIYLNDGSNNFSQYFFYHLNGAYAAIPDDYDLDGDIDLAAISFFPDFDNHPEEGFVFLENMGNMHFDTYSLPEVSLGRWIVMDKGDLDQDGDQDLVLGSLAFEVISERSEEITNAWINSGIPYIVLQNNVIP